MTADKFHRSVVTTAISDCCCHNRVHIENSVSGCGYAVMPKITEVTPRKYSLTRSTSVSMHPLFSVNTFTLIIQRFVDDKVAVVEFGLNSTAYEIVRRRTSLSNVSMFWLYSLKYS